METVSLQQELARAYRASEELLREKNRVSFGSLITGAVGLLERDAQLREALQKKYRYILVDEFQDTNIAQLRLLELLAGPARNILAVGDNRSEEHTSELQSLTNLVCRLLLEKK